MQKLIRLAQETPTPNHTVPEIPLSARDRIFLGNDIETGLPSARFVLRVPLLPNINSHKSLEDFSEQIPIFPTCVAAKENLLHTPSPDLSSEEARVIISGAEVRALVSLPIHSALC